MEWWKNVSLSSRFTIVLATTLVLLIFSFVFSDYRRQHNLTTSLAVQNARFVSGILLEQLHNTSIEEFPQMQTPTCYNPAELRQQLIRATGNKKVVARVISLDSTKSMYTPDVFETGKLESIKVGRTDSCDILNTGNDKSILYMRPLVATGRCLGCHGSAQNVSDKMRQYFPEGNRIFGHKNDDVMGALVVSLPVRSLDAMIWRNAWKQSVSLLFGGALLVLIVNILLRLLVLKPLEMLSSSDNAASHHSSSYAPEISALFLSRENAERARNEMSCDKLKVDKDKERGAA